MKKRFALLFAVLLALLSLSGCINTALPTLPPVPTPTATPTATPTVIPTATPEAVEGGYTVTYKAENGNIPYFTDEEKRAVTFEDYAELDALGRCGVAMACLSRELMPTEERGDIGYVKPTGWHSIRYDNVEGKYLYNRCHLIGFQLAGENANTKNLITGTRNLNNEGMLPFENMIADYIKETDNHVLYRVTPVFVGNELVARGVRMEAWSVEDNGEGICFCVFVHNTQPGIIINYADGTSRLDGTTPSPTATPVPEAKTYVLNTNTKKFHYPTCRHAADIKENNRAERTVARDELINEGYTPCGVCKP